MGDHFPQASGNLPLAPPGRSVRGPFWSGGDLATLYRNVETKGRAGTGLESIFESGFGEFSRLLKLGTAADLLLEGARRSMRVAQDARVGASRAQSRDARDRRFHQPVCRPVRHRLGIMSAFHNLGNVQQATLAAVAPGIAEALITTAIGLFAAIPAVVAYNRFADQVSRLELRFDTFVEEFSTILQRHGSARGARADTDGRHRSTPELMGEINVVPYIDVMLVLLIIFMITAPLLKEGIKVDLPTAGAKPSIPRFLQKHEPLIVTIDARGQMYLNFGPQSRTSRPRRATVSARTAALLRRDRKRRYW